MDRLDLDSSCKVSWNDVFNDKFGPSNDTILGILACRISYISDDALKCVELLINKCIERGGKDLWFVKNDFGMNMIDWLMRIDNKSYYSDRSKFAKMLIRKFKINKEQVELSYKKATYALDLGFACQVSDFSRIKKVLDEMKDNFSCMDVVSMCYFDTEIYSGLNVKCFFFYMSYYFCLFNLFFFYSFCILLYSVK